MKSVITLLTSLLAGPSLASAQIQIPLSPTGFSNGLGAGAYESLGANPSSYVDVSQYCAGGKGDLDVVGSDGSGSSVSPVQYSVYLSYSVNVSGPSGITIPVDFAVAGYASIATVGDNYALVSSAYDGFTAQAARGAEESALTVNRLLWAEDSEVDYG